jgi:hypothetical protein
MARALLDGATAALAHRIRCPDHVAFLSSTMAYQKYVAYRNEKIEEMHSIKRRASASRDRSKEIDSRQNTFVTHTASTSPSLPV